MKYKLIEGAVFIQLLRDCSGNHAGEIIQINLITENDIYYTDGLSRWACLNKFDENKNFKYVTQSTAIAHDPSL